jgi:hypothetical protein
MVKRFIALWILAFLLIACDSDTGGGASNQSRLFDWDDSADFILFRMDAIDTEISDYAELQLANTIPDCTIYGSGRSVMTSESDGENEVLEARLTEDRIRAFLEDVIGMGYYSWEDDLLQEGSDTTLRSISLNLYAEARTIERYGEWPVDAYERLADMCRNLSTRRALVAPLQGGWLRVVPAPDAEFGLGAQQWPRTAPFSLQDVAISGSPLWVDDRDWAQYLWEVALESELVPIYERDRAYYISFQIPGISRSAPPLPLETQTNN